jgi:hypothetical protein
MSLIPLLIAIGEIYPPRRSGATRLRPGCS